MSEKPLVGITAWRRVLATFYGPERLQTLAVFYGEAVAEAGMIPLIIPNGQDPGQAAAIVSSVDGLLLSGGDDVDPRHIGHRGNINLGANLQVASRPADFADEPLRLAAGFRKNLDASLGTRLGSLAVELGHMAALAARGEPPRLIKIA